jgi:NAD(P)-dependent dehydrogenase (short-subunit alcohol dehydrogenase family)
MDVTGKVVLITGAARGIGAEVARRLATKGAKVALVGLEGAQLNEVAEQCGGKAWEADVTDWEALETAVAGVVEHFGGIDVVVANAGVAATGFVRSMDPKAFERVIEVNLLGVWRTVRAALPEVVRRGGHVVVVASVYAFMNGMGAVSYAMAKAGVEQLGRALRVELAQHGAGASVAYFGFIDTEMVRTTIDADPVSDRMMSALPGPLHKRLQPSAAGEAIARGIERRRPRIIRPRRWAALSVLRGVVNPLVDARASRDAAVQDVIRELDAR